MLFYNLTQQGINSNESNDSNESKDLWDLTGQHPIPGMGFLFVSLWYLLGVLLLCYKVTPFYPF